MEQDTLIKRLMATFLEELEEQVAALNADLLALEKDSSEPHGIERLRALFRTAHSLKGAARAANVPLIESACHHLEEMLAAARDGQAPLAPAAFALLFETVDAVGEAGVLLREQRDLAGTAGWRRCCPGWPTPRPKATRTRAPSGGKTARVRRRSPRPTWAAAPQPCASRPKSSTRFSRTTASC